MSVIEVLVPDIGDFEKVPVIEVLVSEGDTVQAEDALVTLESDKATMDVPAPQAGVVRSIRVAVGDEVSQGTVILDLEANAASPSPESIEASSEGHAPEVSAGAAGAAPAELRASEPPSTAGNTAPPASGEPVLVIVPDIGDFSDIPVIDVLVSVGDVVQAEDALVTLESDKATMDVPSPSSGTVVAIRVSVGDTVSEGVVVVELNSTPSAAGTDSPEAGAPEPAAESVEHATAAPEEANPTPRPAPASAPRADSRPSPTAALTDDPPAKTKSHATPTLRRFARALGVSLDRVTGTGRKGRITRDDVERFVKGELAKPAAAPSASGTGVPPMPDVDFGKFGEIETRPLSRIKRISGPHLQRAWLNVPHVTNHDEADITDLEAFRKSLKDEAAARNVRVTMLGFIVKALSACLVKYPQFNASISNDGASLILKRYYNVGIAIDTPNGLVVPVVKDANAKSVYEISESLGQLSLKARDGKLAPSDIQGGCMSISSLGGIGGIGFTPIVNAPEVAILGVSRSRMSPVWNGSEFVPRLMLPLDLSYDHRAIDGAEAARFLVHLKSLLEDMRLLLM